MDVLESLVVYFKSEEFSHTEAGSAILRLKVFLLRAHYQDIIGHRLGGVA